MSISMSRANVSHTFDPGPLPSREEVEAKIRNLLNGILAHEDVAVWASQWTTQFAPRVNDPTVWEALLSLSGADTLEGPGVYLHTEPDFHAWLDELQRARIEDDS